MRRAVWCLVVLGACQHPPAANAPAPDLPGPDISPASLRRDLYAFAADSMHGRLTGSVDAERAGRFLADRIQALGLEPAGDSMFVQRIPLERNSFAVNSRVLVEANGRVIPLEIGRDLVPVINLGAGVLPAKRYAAGEIVFVSYAIQATRPRRDDLAGLDLEGKVVVLVNGAPRGADSAMRNALEAQGAIGERLARILPMRPAAVVVLLAGAGEEVFRQIAPDLTNPIGVGSMADDVLDSERPVPMILLGRVSNASALLPPGWPADERPRAVPRRFVAQIALQRTPITAWNVVGVVRRRDPTLSRTYVALGAHYDHIGIVPPVNGDSIANGADDDGSGSMALLEIARSMMRGPRPKRSTLFVWHVGEEQGLLGSTYFVEHPTVPIDSIVAQINADMIGRNAPSELYVVGPRAAPNGLSRRLGAIVDSVNAAEPAPFTIDRSWDSATHPEHIYERSDHYNYARKGVPIAFFTTGAHGDYHMPGDEPSKIDYEKLARVARLMRDIAIAVGDSPKRPR